MRLAENPKDKEVVGADGVVKVLMKNLAPGLSEKLGAKQMHSLQTEKSPPAGDSQGAVRRPSAVWTEVSAGRFEADR